MDKLRKTIGMAILVVIGIINISLYRNLHLYNKTRTIGNYVEKIQTLEQANRIFPYNNRVYTELGRTYFEMASLDFQNIELRDAYFEKSIQNFIRSIKLNPGYYQSHFYFAQALSYQQYFAPIKFDFYNEYKKAAYLTTFDTQAYFEVGRFLFTHWIELSEEDKKYTLSLLKNLRTNRENLQTIMQIWAINGGDFSVMEEILPREAAAYRTFAQFLAERRLSINERHKKLAQAEYMDFTRAKNSFAAGERQAQFQNVNRAISLFNGSLNTIENIRFYQNLTGETLIDLSEFFKYKKAIHLNLAKNQIIKSGNLRDAETNLRKYIEMENDAAEIGALELFLNERNLLKANPGTYFNDLFSYFIKVNIEFKLNRFRSITESGKDLKESFSTAPENLSKDLVRICQLIGESYQELDFLYESEAFFQLAMDLDPTHLGSLKGMRQNFLKMNKPEMANVIENQIDSLVTPEEINFENLTIRHDQNFKQTFILKEKKIGIIFTFQGIQSTQPPLIAVEFNDQLVWEGYLGSQNLSLSVNSEEGTNVLTIHPSIRDVTLNKIVYTVDSETIQNIERERQTVYESKQPKLLSPPPVEDKPVESQPSEPILVPEQKKRVDSKPSEPVKTPVEAESKPPTQKSEYSSSMSFINGVEYSVMQDSLEVEVLTDPFLNFNSFELSNPSRIVIDISGIADIKSGRQFEVNEHPVKSIRLGMFKSDTARAVFYVDTDFLRYSVEKTSRGIKVIFISK